MDVRDEAWRRHGLGDRAADWLDATADLFVCLDADLLLLYANRAFESATGLAFGDSTGRPLGELRPFGEATQDALLLLAAARDGSGATEAEFTWCPRGDTGPELRHQVQAGVERGGGRQRRAVPAHGARRDAVPRDRAVPAAQPG